MNGPMLCRFGHMMGLPVIVDSRAPLPSAPGRLIEKVFAWLSQVEELFNVYCAHSEVNCVDQGLIRPCRMDPLVREVLTACARLNDRTNGYFDIYSTGRLDPWQYVKGWAVQRASALLTQAGAGNHCVQMGEDVAVSGHPAPGLAWRVPIQDPCRPSEVAWIRTATDLAVATVPAPAATDAIRNPLTRRPAAGLASVTVAGPDLGDASAYATAALAMGTAGLDWLPTLQGHVYAAVDDKGQCFHGGRLPSVSVTPTPQQRMRSAARRLPG
jgi:thiamine biosynthesis lipoprotein